MTQAKDPMIEAIDSLMTSADPCIIPLQKHIIVKKKSISTTDIISKQVNMIKIPK